MTFVYVVGLNYLSGFKITLPVIGGRFYYRVHELPLTLQHSQTVGHKATSYSTSTRIHSSFALFGRPRGSGNIAKSTKSVRGRNNTSAKLARDVIIFDASGRFARSGRILEQVAS